MCRWRLVHSGQARVLHRILQLSVLLLSISSVLNVQAQSYEQGFPQVRFEIEIEAVLAKAGCNMGACHGNLNGKGGFKLSLRGQRPSDDYRWLTREYGSRRLSVFDPEQRLIL